MKFLRYIGIIGLIVGSTAQAYHQTAITFDGGGLLGDKLKHYYRAKFLAHKHNIPFYGVPSFPHKEEFIFAKEESVFEEKMKHDFKQIKIVYSEDDLNPILPNTLYIVYRTVKLPEISNAIRTAVTFNNEYPEFLEQMRRLIAPVKPIVPLDLPTDRATVAVHVRRTCRHGPLIHREPGEEKKQKKDNELWADLKWPLRFPPDEYYIREIRRVSNMLGDVPLYVYLFTDSKFPQKVVEKYEKDLDLPNIIFDYRKNNDCKANILDDLFAMTQFDYIVRSSSGYSGLALILGNHKIAIGPKHSYWRDDYMVVDRVWLVERDQQGMLSKASLQVDEKSPEEFDSQ